MLIQMRHQHIGKDVFCESDQMFLNIIFCSYPNTLFINSLKRVLHKLKSKTAKNNTNSKVTLLIAYE